MADNIVWGIDIGQCAIKAIKLREVDDRLLLEGYEVIEHPEILTQPDVDVGSIVRASLGELLRRQDVSDARIALSVLGRSSFTRFVQLPPVEKKKIPEIVRFEAEQQIPFPFSEVIWRYKCFQNPDSPDVEVGLFAIKQTDMAETLSYFLGVELEADVIQMPPLALYNFMIYDGQVDMEGASIALDIGADKSHLVIADGSRLWIRTIRIGGSNFTEALAKSFKLSYAKAEKLKKTAASSKYARQVFQVMRPIFADVVQEIQRSIGFYTSQHRDARFAKIIGMGNGFRLPGIRKYLEQNLNITVTPLSEFKRLDVPDDGYKQAVLGLSVAYGLALQALDKAPVNTNMLPDAIINKRLWNKKKVWFAASAVLLVISSALICFSAMQDAGVLQDSKQKQHLAAIDKLLADKSGEHVEYDKVQKNDLEPVQALGKQQVSMRAYSNFWPTLFPACTQVIRSAVVPRKEMKLIDGLSGKSEEEISAIASSVRSIQGKYELICRLPCDAQDDQKEGETSLRQDLVNGLQSIPRQQREILILEGMTTHYTNDSRDVSKLQKIDGLDSLGFEIPDNMPLPVRGFLVIFKCRTLLPSKTVTTDKTWIPDIKQELQRRYGVSRLDPRRPFGVIDMEGHFHKATVGMGGTVAVPEGTQAKADDPLFTGESMGKDFTFELFIRVMINDPTEVKTEGVR